MPSTPEFKAIGELEKETASSYGVDINLNLIDQSTLIVNAVLGDFEATGFLSIGDANIDPMFFTGDTVKPLGEIALNFSRLDDPQLTQDFVDYRSSPDPAAIRPRPGTGRRNASPRT